MFCQCYFKIVKNVYSAEAVTTQTTGEILQTNLRSYLRTLHHKNVSLV